jgi:hypothetical protein
VSALDTARLTYSKRSREYLAHLPECPKGVQCDHAPARLYFAAREQLLILEREALERWSFSPATSRVS